MDKETLKTYSVIGLSLILVASLFFGNQPDPTHYCDAETSQRYCFDISGGAGTRCYLTPEKNSWDTCKSGWQPIPEWADEVADKVKINANNCLHECALSEGELTSYTICTCDNGQYAYAGELI